MFLVRFRCQYDQCSPWSVVIFHNSILFEFFYQLEHDLGFVRTISWWFATDWGRGSGVDIEFETPDSFLHTFFSKDVPVVLYECFNLWLMFERAISPLYALLEFWVVSVVVEADSVVSGCQWVFIFVEDVSVSFK